MIHGFYLVFRLDDDPKWNVMDGVSLKPKDVQHMFISTPTDLVLPRVHADILGVGPSQSPLPTAKP